MSSPYVDLVHKFLLAQVVSCFSWELLLQILYINFTILCWFSWGFLYFCVTVINELFWMKHFETKYHWEGFPVQNSVQRKIEACWALQKLGKIYVIRHIKKILNLLSPTWNHVKETIFQKHDITCYKFYECFDGSGE